MRPTEHESPRTPTQARNTPRILVTGAGRCGTMYLARLLQANGYDAVHEPLPTGERYLEKRITEHAQGWTPIGRQPWLFRTRAKLPRLEINPYLSLFAADYTAAYPHARLVLLHRDGRDSVTSQLRNGPEHLHRTWPGQTPFESALNWWRMTNETVLSERPHTLAFEDLTAGGETTRNALYAALDLEPGTLTIDTLEPENQTPPRRRHRAPAPPDWPETHQDLYADVCGPIEDTLGRSP